jgi:pilus assembly protein CpaB
MRQLPGWVWLVLAVGFAALASYMALGWLKRQAAVPVVKEKASIVVVVTKDKADPGTFLTAAQLKTEVLHPDKPPQDFFVSVEPVIGREVIKALKPGDLITRENTGEKRVGIITQLGPNQRAMTVKVDEASGVAGFLAPGDRVDVVVIIDKGAYNKDPRSKILLQNIRILGTGQKMENRPGDKPQVVPTVTLEVSPEQGERLALAAQEGRVSLVLRGPGDHQEVQTSGTGTSQLLGIPKQVTAAPFPPPRRTVDVIRGIQRQAVDF